MNKTQLAKKLAAKRVEEGLADAAGNLKTQDAKRFENAQRANGPRKKTRVLVKERLQEIWNNMEQTSLPTWVSRAPHHCGDGKLGKINVDQWRTCHAWRYWVFERWSYMLQMIQTNGHFGELEKTMFERLCMGQKLRQIIQSNKLSKCLQRLAPVFDKAFQDDIRGTHLNDMLAF
ncbi:hypothetical protein BV25DRAFT_1922397 [Artomyces pyxidatus]|uniref:Uncharacterized protein n=1 Tax=Artomyces pyxidatus TaxID=48021 RepID=A0ACB8SGC7_9AGAM|nr:hypothetical protein BV25DRAFT_1922397 [Artomyces pyxidatus]